MGLDESSPTNEDIQAALDFVKKSGFQLSESQSVQDLQIKTLALQFSLYRQGCVAPSMMQDSEEAKQAEVSRRLRGNNSIFSGVTMVKSMPTDIILFIKRRFMPSRKKTLLLLGATGCGKTHSAIAYVSSEASLIGLNKTNAEFVEAYDLAILASSSHSDSKSEIVRYTKIPFLILDDIGAEQEGYKGKDFTACLQGIINKRHEYRLTTIITSNLTFEQFKATYGARVVSRIQEIGIAYESNGVDLRKAGIINAESV